MLGRHLAFLKGVRAECWDSIDRRNVRGRDHLMALAMTMEIVNIPRRDITPDCELGDGSSFI
jgi:hypothetical protein